jgi:uncharacterized protein
MTALPKMDRLVMLSSHDLPDAQQLLVHSCEDCACAVIRYPVDESPNAFHPGHMPDSSTWICGPEILEIQLDPDYKILFNPVGRGGVVVVNEPVHQIFRSFKRSATLREVRAMWPGSDAEVDYISQRLNRLQMIYPVGQIRTPEFPSGDLLTAWLHVTNACNLRCPYCYISKSGEKMDQSIGHAAVEAVMRSAVENGFPAVKLKYAGGEASLNQRLMLDLHSYAQELAAKHGLQLHATLLSNGVKLSPALVETMKAERIQVMISLDGLGAEHDAQRPFANGKPSFRLVERTIAQLIEQDHAPHISITITNRNVDCVADIARFALKRDLTFSINLFRDNDCAASFPDLRYEEKTLISSLLDTFEVIEEFLPRWSVLGSILDRGQLLQPRQRSCGVGQDYVVIDQRGRVAKCHMEIEKTLGDIFNDDPLRLVRQDRTTVLNLLVEEKEGCRDCSWRYWCSGGCSVATFRATGRYDIKSPNCNIYKAIYPRALRLEALRLLKYA